MCSCGHPMCDHVKPTGEREPYGKCKHCDCREGWKVEDPE